MNPVNPNQPQNNQRTAVANFYIMDNSFATTGLISQNTQLKEFAYKLKNENEQLINQRQQFESTISELRQRVSSLESEVRDVNKEKRKLLRENKKLKLQVNAFESARKFQIADSPAQNTRSKKQKNE